MALIDVTGYNPINGWSRDYPLRLVFRFVGQVEMTLPCVFSEGGDWGALAAAARGGGRCSAGGKGGDVVVAAGVVSFAAPRGGPRVAVCAAEAGDGLAKAAALAAEWEAAVRRHGGG